MVGFTSYNIDNDRRFKRALQTAIKRVGDLRFVMGEISRDIFKTTRQNFILSGSGQYPALSPQYAKFKQRTYGFSPILVASGDLRDSVTGKGNSDTVLNIGKQSLVQGTKVPYARYVQEGTVKMPGRKYLFIDDAQADRFVRMIDNYVTSRLEVLGNAK